ncbi:hypothetical protein D9758_018959 [Tetrapyrgos nigripes]|uniref:Carboxylesterase type B domain-containing protein n=1 Tax=Tetrapyrgos nigripes TaxID=182062 RepID=A0A8H5AUJ4_9AGAR|nr:hypothetical protein D9758_018959 [Tetrapyrgos nigripes]
MRSTSTSSLIWISGLLLSPLSLCSVLSSSPRADEPNVVDLGYVKYRGSFNETFPNTVAYLGIPYAEPPLGNLRFRNPVPLNKTRISQEAGEEVIDATDSFFADGGAGGAGNEDCLKVNVYAPQVAKPGDDFTACIVLHPRWRSMAIQLPSPSNTGLLKVPTVVIVSVYYRLDSFGFLAIPEFSDSSMGDMNAGFQNQTQALRWIQENIKDWESAGGGSVELHLVAIDQEGLFSGAIAQSVYRSPTITLEQRQPLFDFYSNQAGCGDVSVPNIERVACLRNASISALARAQDAAAQTFNGSYRLFVPVQDGKIITAPPTSLFESGQFWKVPIMVGATSNESVADLSGTIASIMLRRFPGLDDVDIREFEAVTLEASSWEACTRLPHGDPNTEPTFQVVRCSKPKGPKYRGPK